jgi:hypothetical protein
MRKRKQAPTRNGSYPWNCDRVQAPSKAREREKHNELRQRKRRESTIHKLFETMK